VKKDDRKLLKESSYPSYMVFSISEMEEIFESFANIFKSVWSSIKLLSNTLLLNLKLITYNVTLDKKKIAAAKEDFATSRATYDAETKKNLKYFRKYYSDSNVETLWGAGPGMLAFIANPFLFAAVHDPDSEPPDTGGLGPPRTQPAAPPAAAFTKSERLKRALAVFGFSQTLSEQVQPATTSLPNEAAIKEANKLKEIARLYAESEASHAKELSKQMADRSAVIKKIVDASTFDEMIAAAAEGEKIKMGLSSAAFKTSSKKIDEGLEKQRKEDPATFKQAIADMRKKAPEITEQDDVKAMSQFLFGVSKSRIQKQAAASYESLVFAAKEAMNLPIDPRVEAQLRKTDIGTQYLTMLENFERSLNTGKQEMLKISKEKV